MLQLIRSFFKRSSVSIVGRTMNVLETEREYHDDRVRTLEETIAVANEQLRQHKEARAAYDDAIMTLSVSVDIGDTLSIPHISLAADMARDIERAKTSIGSEYAQAC